MPNLYALRGAAQPLAFVEDIGVPPESLAKFLHEVQDVLQQHETTASYLVHAATGQVHIRPFLDLHRREDVARLWPLADALYTVVFAFGGTISTQHGTGLARTPWVNKQYQRLYPVFSRLKAIFDPRHLLNPGKIVGPAPGMPAWPLRRFETRPDLGQGPETTSQRVELMLQRDTDEGPQLRWLPRNSPRKAIVATVAASVASRRHPSECARFFASATTKPPRLAQGERLAQLLHPDSDPRLLSSEEVRDIADLCVNCKMCARECPAHVNVPDLMLETKAAYVAQHGLDRGDWAVARTEQFAHLGSTFAPVANELLASPIARWLLEKLLGVSRHRRLPAFAHQLLAACSAAWLDAQATLSSTAGGVFRGHFRQLQRSAHCGSRRRSAASQWYRGVRAAQSDRLRHAPLAAGDVETARETLQHNLRALRRTRS